MKQLVIDSESQLKGRLHYTYVGAFLFPLVAAQFPTSFSMRYLYRHGVLEVVVRSPAVFISISHPLDLYTCSHIQTSLVMFSTGSSCRTLKRLVLIQQGGSVVGRTFSSLFSFHESL